MGISGCAPRTFERAMAECHRATSRRVESGVAVRCRSAWKAGWRLRMGKEGWLTLTDRKGDPGRTIIGWAALPMCDNAAPTPVIVGSIERALALLWEESTPDERHQRLHQGR